MKFFTDAQKMSLAITGLVGGGLTVFSYVIGKGFGSLIGHMDADDFAKEKACLEVWKLFHYIYKEQQNVTAICGESCADVCESASALICELVKDYGEGFAVAGGVLSLATLGLLVTRYYLQNREDPELQSLEEGSQVNYSA